MVWRGGLVIDAICLEHRGYIEWNQLRTIIRKDLARRCKSDENLMDRDDDNTRGASRVERRRKLVLPNANLKNIGCGLVDDKNDWMNCMCLVVFRTDFNNSCFQKCNSKSLMNASTKQEITRESIIVRDNTGCGLYPTDKTIFSIESNLQGDISVHQVSNTTHSRDATWIPWGKSVQE